MDNYGLYICSSCPTITNIAITSLVTHRFDSCLLHCIPLLRDEFDDFVTLPLSHPSSAVDLHVAALSQRALQVLWHARTGHINARRLKDAHHHVTGIPSNLPSSDDLNACPVCITCKMRRRAASTQSSRTARQLNEGLSIDFGFIVHQSSSLPALNHDDLSDHDHLCSCNGETAYLLVRDHWSGALLGTCTINKAPPVDWLTYWLLHHPCSSPTKYVRLDQGGDLSVVIGKERRRMIEAVVIVISSTQYILYCSMLQHQQKLQLLHNN
jgi:hypothetical protein